MPNAEFTQRKWSHIDGLQLADPCTPRPPSAGHGFSPAVCASPSTPYQLSSHSAASLPSPQSNASQPAGGPAYGFSFPSFDINEKTDKDNLNNNNNSNNNNNNPQQIGTMAGSMSNGGAVLLGNTIAGSVSQHQQHNTPPHPQPDSERLRHLLTNKSHSLTSSLLGTDSSDDKDNNLSKFYKQGLVNADEDKDGNGPGGSSSSCSSIFKMSAGGPNSRFGSGLQKSSNSSNPMLLSLLNERPDDDESKGGATTGRQSELLRQLQKDDGHHGHSHSHGHGSHSSNLSTEELKRILKIQGDPSMTRKRSLNEPDDGISPKRSEDRPSKLRAKNKMLASLLENPPKIPVLQTPPQVKTIPDITSSTVNRVSSTLGSLGAGPTTSSLGMSTKSATLTTTQANTANIVGTGRGGGRKQQQQQQQPSDAYLTQHQQQQNLVAAGVANLQRPQQQTQMSYASVEHSFVSSPLNTTATSATAAATSTVTSQAAAQQLQSLSAADGDPELSQLLDSVMDYVADDQPFVATTPTAITGLTQQEMNERVAISAIQKSLMVETSVYGTGQQAQLQQQQPQPPAYPGNMLGNLVQQQQQQQQHQQQMLQLIRNSQAGGAQQQASMQQLVEVMRANVNQGFQRPPPMYTARGRVPMNAVATPGGNVISPAQQYRAMKQQQAQKERLLQQQQKQQLLVPESATARNDQLCLNPGINNIGTLLNTTVAPNVSLSRTNMPSDSQLSPNFAQSMMQQQLSPGQRNALFSPQPNQGYVPQYPQNAQRLSPQQQQQLNQQANAQQQQQLSFQNAQGQGGVSVAAQLSPRQPTYGAGNAGGNAGVVQSPGMSNASPQQWVAAAAAVAANNANNAAQRGGHSLQQHNPMLSAQLQGVSPYNARQYQSQRRGLNSPSGAVPGSMTTVTLQRQNSFQTNDSGFSGPSTSPSPQSPYGAGTTVFQQQQMQRMQRQSSVPQATQHLPGSPRPFGGTNSSNLDNGGVVGVNNTLSGNISINGGNGGVIPISGNGYGGAAGMMYNNMPSQGGPHTPNDFYGRTQTAGNTSNSSEFVKQELRAVVSGRAQQQNAAAAAAAAAAANASGAGGNGVPGGGGNNGGVTGNVVPGGLRAITPQSPLSGMGPMIGGNASNCGGNNVNANTLASLQQQQTGNNGGGGGSCGNGPSGGNGVTVGGNGCGNNSNSLLHTPPDPTMNFNFDAQDFFGSSATR
ncbi:neurogenic protein mastermind-like [Teleopsis dalmanni]|uniref:neurogenic protein mastermind-like n=1 Tax=Teleopsis dalmanni TaxID=139649 RepID=UPI0018CDAA76|nr:neurogenic protein mastermind-like [Teleopsis dalmanni]